MPYRQAVPFTASLDRGFLESVPSDSVNRNDDSVNKLFTDIQLQRQQTYNYKPKGRTFVDQVIFK